MIRILHIEEVKRRFCILDRSKCYLGVMISGVWDSCWYLFGGGRTSRRQCMMIAILGSCFVWVCGEDETITGLIFVDINGKECIIIYQM